MSNSIDELDASAWLEVYQSPRKAPVVPSVVRSVGGSQRDPNGLDPHAPGAKLDEGKLDLTLVPPELVEQVARVMMFGAAKYTRGGWQHVEDGPLRYYAALRRHLHAFEGGEDLDPETGLHHLAHAAANLAFLLAFAARRPEQDIGGWRECRGSRTDASETR